MQDLTTSEKVRIELKRKCMTQQELAEQMEQSRFTIGSKMKSNSWNLGDIYIMRYKLKFEL
jgi:IS30 family transposase